MRLQNPNFKQYKCEYYCITLLPKKCNELVLYNLFVVNRNIINHYYNN